MRKNYLLFFICLLFYSLANSQVNYTFSALSGTYTPLAGGITPPLVSPDPDPVAGYTTTDEGYSNAVPIGFTFNYNGTNYTTLNINVNGFVSLGDSMIQDPAENYYRDTLMVGPISQPSVRPLIAPFWGDHDIQLESNLTYTVSGTAPNRVMTIEWAHVLWRYTATNPSVSFQLKLYETTNVIEFVYQQEAGATSNPRAAIGLTSELTGPGSFLSVSDPSASPTVSSTVESKIRTVPATGQIYRFTPLACIPPTNAQLTNVTATSATLSYNAVAGAAGYEYKVDTSATAPTGSGTPTTATSVNVSLQPGVNYVYVRTNCGGTFSLWKRLATIPCTTNVSPANGATNVSVSPTFVWNAVRGATGYSIMISVDNGVTYFNVGTFAAPDTSVTLSGGAYATTYYWYVRPVAGSDTASETCSSNAWSFTTENTPTVPVNDDVCGAIVLTVGGPADCQNTVSATSANDPALSCSTPNNTLWYTYTPAADGKVIIKMKRPSASPNGLDAWVALFTATGSCPSLTLTQAFPCTETDLSTEDSVVIASDVLTGGVTYYIMIDGFAGATGEFCISLEAVPAPPVTCATLLMPANNATNVPTANTTFTWTSVPASTGYGFFLGATLPPDSLGVTPDTTVTLSGLAYNTTYYWTVIPENAGGQSSGCSGTVFTFTTGAPPPPPANDECTGAYTLTSAPLPGTTVGGTESLPAIVCGGFTGDANDDVWYTFTAANNGDATITLVPDGMFDGTMQLFDGSCTSLNNLTCADAYGPGGTETLTATNLTAGTTYYLRVYEYGASGSEGTFTLLLSGSILPVRIAAFRGEKTGTENTLYWNTNMEQNNKGFELQRSADGENFGTLSFINSKALNGNSNTSLSYTYVDRKPINGNNYYRLKQQDKDGRTTVSDVVLIKGQKAGAWVMTNVYPNPAKSLLRVVLNGPVNEEVKIIVTDMAGKVVIQQPVRAIAGENNVSVNVANLASGSYMIKAVCENGCEASASKFLKQ